jgi:hypothetical protein
MSDYQTIRYQRQGDIGTLTVARPGERNAQNPLRWEEPGRLGAGRAVAGTFSWVPDLGRE